MKDALLSRAEVAGTPNANGREIKVSKDAGAWPIREYHTRTATLNPEYILGLGAYMHPWLWHLNWSTTQKKGLKSFDADSHRKTYLVLILAILAHQVLHAMCNTSSLLKNSTTACLFWLSFSIWTGSAVQWTSWLCGKSNLGSLCWSKNCYERGVVR